MEWLERAQDFDLKLAGYGNMSTASKINILMFCDCTAFWRPPLIRSPGVGRKMEREEYRAVIKFFFLKGWNATQVKTELTEVCGSSSPSFATVSNWINEFKRGRLSTKDEPRSGRPKTATSEENVEKVHQMVMEDRHFSTWEIAHKLKISQERVCEILRENLNMRKLLAHWVPRRLTDVQKQQRVALSHQFLELLKKDPKDFWRRFVTVDETWVHFYTPEQRSASREWTKRGEMPPTTSRTSTSTKKIMATVFWDERGILLLDFLETGKTINGEYYAGLLDKLKDAITRTRPGLKKKKLLFHQDNAPPHKSGVAMAKLDKLGFEITEHPAYSPDLAPSDYYLFTNLKKHLAGTRFS